jgi:predicted nucleic acid-binding protein
VILIDTSVWIEHVRERNDSLVALLVVRKVLVHPFVIGEVALGYLRSRNAVLAELQLLPQALVATSEEVLRFIEQSRLFGVGIGYVDVHLLAAVSLTADARLWTLDKNLHAAAAKLGLAHVSSNWPFRYELARPNREEPKCPRKPV